jgi:hypothetical protein
MSKPVLPLPCHVFCCLCAVTVCAEVPRWVVMSAKDLARWGLLVASGGEWKGKRLISRVQGHGGGNGSHVGGTGGNVLGCRGRVAATFNHGAIPWKLFDKPPGPDSP